MNSSNVGIICLPLEAESVSSLVFRLARDNICKVSYLNLPRVSQNIYHRAGMKGRTQPDYILDRSNLSHASVAMANK